MRGADISAPAGAISRMPAKERRGQRIDPLCILSRCQLRRIASARVVPSECD